jgi:uncharacterized RmlC-like cupin family protein
MKPDKIAIEPTYKKENGVWTLSLEAIPIPIHFRPRQKSIVCLPPEASAGNHRHQRTEIFVGIGEELEIVWLDKGGEQKSEKMNPSGKLFVFKVPPYLPHAIRNNSKKHSAFLLEHASTALRDVEEASVI